MNQKIEENFYNILNESLEEMSTTYIYETKKKKGREKIKKNFSSHDKCKKDNIRSIIMTHFQKYIISFLNDLAKKFISDTIFLFRKIDFNERKKINIQSIKKFVEMNISDYCKLKISKKYKKKVEPYENQKNFEIIKDYFPKEIKEIKIRIIYEQFYISQNYDILKEKYGLTNEMNFFSLLNEKKDEGLYYLNKLKKTGLNLIKDLDKKKSIDTNQYISKKRFYGIKKEEEKNKINEYYNENVKNKTETFDDLFNKYIIFEDTLFMNEKKNYENDEKNYYSYF